MFFGFLVISRLKFNILKTCLALDYILVCMYKKVWKNISKILLKGTVHRKTHRVNQNSGKTEEISTYMLYRAVLIFNHNLLPSKGHTRRSQTLGIVIRLLIQQLWLWSVFPFVTFCSTEFFILISRRYNIEASYRFCLRVKTPKKRHWRTSVWLLYSTDLNVAFVLFGWPTFFLLVLLLWFNNFRLKAGDWRCVRGILLEIVRCYYISIYLCIYLSI